MYCFIDSRAIHVQSRCDVLQVTCGTDDEIRQAEEALQGAGFQAQETAQASDTFGSKWEHGDKWGIADKHLAPGRNIALLVDDRFPPTGIRRGPTPVRVFVRGGYTVTWDSRPVPFLREAYEQQIARLLKEVKEHMRASRRQRVYKEAVATARKAEGLDLRLCDELSSARIQALLDDPSLTEAVKREEMEEAEQMREMRERDHQLCISDYNAWRMENK